MLFNECSKPDGQNASVGLNILCEKRIDFSGAVLRWPVSVGLTLSDYAGNRSEHQNLPPGSADIHHSAVSFFVGWLFDSFLSGRVQMVASFSPEMSSDIVQITVMISGSGTNLQALIDATMDDTLPNASIIRVISNRAKACEFHLTIISTLTYGRRP